MQLDDVGKIRAHSALACCPNVETVPSLTVGSRVEEAMWRSVRWLDRCIAHHEQSGRNNVQNLFAIVQGGLDTKLRDFCLDEMIKRKESVAGYAIGGLSGGEAKGGFLFIYSYVASQTYESDQMYSGECVPCYTCIEWLTHRKQ